MPVSNPSYFPPNRGTGSVVGITAGTTTTGSRNFLALKDAGDNSTASDLMVIGDSSCTQGLTSTNITKGLICLGNTSMNGVGLKDSTASGILGIGERNAPHAGGDLGGLIMIGSAVLNNAVFNTTGSTANTANILIGNNTLQQYGADSTSTLHDNVVIGHNALINNSNPNSAMNTCVFIGSETGDNISSNSISAVVAIGFGSLECQGNTSGNMTAMTVIGASAMLNAQICASTSRVVVIGDQAGNQVAFAGAVDVTIVGSQAVTSATHIFNDTVIGSNSQVSPLGTNNVVLGDNIPSVGTTRNGCILIGSSAGTDITFPNNLDGQLYIGFNGAANGVGAGTAMWGLMKVGNLVLGTSSSAQREFGGSGATNVLKMINGTAGNSNPNGGGYFYVSAGSLHWVGSNGTDTTLAQA